MTIFDYVCNKRTLKTKGEESKIFVLTRNMQNHAEFTLSKIFNIALIRIIQKIQQFKFVLTAHKRLTV